MSYEDNVIYETESFEFIVEFEYDYNPSEMDLELADFTVFVEGVKTPIQISKDLEQDIEEYLLTVLDSLLDSDLMLYISDYEASTIDYEYDMYMGK